MEKDFYRQVFSVLGRRKKKITEIVWQVSQNCNLLLQSKFLCFFFTKNIENFKLFVTPGETKFQKTHFLRKTSKNEQNVLSRFF